MKTVFLCLIAVALIVSCKKKDETVTPTLPLATKVGANTMGCYVNGELHIYSGVPNGFNGNGVSFGVNGSSGSLGGYIFISGNSTEQIGDIELIVYGQSFTTDSAYTDLKGMGGSTTYVPNLVTAEFKVKENDPFNWVKFSRYDNSVVAGTFQFKGFSSDGLDSVVVTQGRI